MNFVFDTIHNNYARSTILEEEFMGSSQICCKILNILNILIEKAHLLEESLYNIQKN